MELWKEETLCRGYGKGAMKSEQCGRIIVLHDRKIISDEANPAAEGVEHNEI